VNADTSSVVSTTGDTSTSTPSTAIVNPVDVALGGGVKEWAPKH
jgi:hypothetical protein